MGKPTGRRITQRNLNSVLAYVDCENVTASRLLTAASGPHGTAKHAVFSEHEAAQYNRLVAWVCQLAQQPMSDTPSTVIPVVPAFPPESAPTQAPPQVLSKDAQKAHPLSAAAHGQTVHRGVAPRPSKPGVDAAQASFDQPVDPFDPAIFNRRHASEQPAEAGPVDMQ